VSGQQLSQKHAKSCCQIHAITGMSPDIRSRVECAVSDSSMRYALFFLMDPQP
jgi:hypothetical protein